MENNFINIEIDAARVCDGLSRIGYTPATAICDIIDNSVQAKANNIWLEIIRDSIRADSAKNNVREYRIIDDGIGMDSEQILGSLKLGSSDSHYESNSLSKFGLGLKSASFSQGEVLEVISRNKADLSFAKYRVSLPLIRKERKYLVEKCELDDEDRQITDLNLKNLTGTIIRIREVRKVNHPPVKKTVDSLKEKLGIIYFYYMTEALNIHIDHIKIEPKDPLFANEAGQNGDLDELNWDGKSVSWIARRKEIYLDNDSGVKAYVEVTNLVHPPTFKLEGGGEQARSQARDKYMISGGNHGFYIYRNKRLIAWAERFDGMITSDQDLYAFRARLIIDSSADEVMNIDVKKSRINLSDDTYDIIENLTSDWVRKSKAAWNSAKRAVDSIPNEDTHTKANIIASKTIFPDELPGDNDDEKTLKEKKRREEDLNQKVKERAKQAGAESSSVDEEGNSMPRLIELVDKTVDNYLWEMYYDATLGTKVRINRHHRFSKLIYDTMSNNKQLSIVMDNLFFTLVQAEKYTIKNQQDIKADVIVEILTAYREAASSYFTKVAQTIDKEIGGTE